MKSLTRMMAVPVWPVLLLALGLLATGCMNRYVITLSSGYVITTKGKPKYDKATDTFRYTDLEGKPRYVPSVSVREVAPRTGRDGKYPGGIEPPGMPSSR